jgi:hypothetical protein
MGHENLVSCIEDNPDLISGDAFPDAFFFGDFVGGSNCTTFGGYHDSTFGVFLMTSARQQQQQQQRHGASGGGGSGARRTFNATAFALGYASHMYADNVGFFSDSLLPPRSTYFNWLSIWSYMTAIDSFQGVNGGLLEMEVPELSDEGAQWVADVAAQYREQFNPALPVVSSDEVRWCAAAWQSVLRDKTREALRSPPEAWRHLLVEFTPFGATTPEEAIAELEVQQRCVADVWRQYITLVSQPDPDPQQITAEMTLFISEIFAEGRCTPAAPATVARRQRGGNRSRSQGNSSKDARKFMGLLGQWPEVA